MLMFAWSCRRKGVLGSVRPCFLVFPARSCPRNVMLFSELAGRNNDATEILRVAYIQEVRCLGEATPTVMMCTAVSRATAVLLLLVQERWCRLCLVRGVGWGVSPSLARLPKGRRIKFRTREETPRSGRSWSGAVESRRAEYARIAFISGTSLGRGKMTNCVLFWQTLQRFNLSCVRKKHYN